MLLHPGLNHLDGRSIDVAFVEGDLEVVPRLGYLNRTWSLSWLAFLEDTGLFGCISACGFPLISF